MTRTRSMPFCASLLGLVPLSVAACTADSPQPTDAAEQSVITPPLPALNLVLNAKTTVTIGASTQVFGDVASGGDTGSVLFDDGSNQFLGEGFDVLANTVTVNANARVDHVVGNIIKVAVNGFVLSRTLGLDPSELPPVPAVTPAHPGTTNVSTEQNEFRQLCPGRYGAISVGINSILNLNGGTYEVTRLTLADGARLLPSEPVVILVSGGMTTGISAIIAPFFAPLPKPVTAADIRIEVGGAVTIGSSNQVEAHLLAPAGKLTTGANTRLFGAAWAKTINIGPGNTVFGEDEFAAHTPKGLATCDDANACTTDSCVSSGASGFCKNKPVPSGTSCSDHNPCNGAETCDGKGTCQPGTNLGAGTSCADSTVCNGDETCDGLGTCVTGTPPEVSDGNTCTADACDPVTGVSHTPLPDGTTCSGVGVCQGGVCLVTGTVFSDDFVQGPAGSPAPEQCRHWNDFLFNQLTAGNYSSVSMIGSRDPTGGVTCNEPGPATQICQALHTGSNASVFCNSHTWNIGQCGGFGGNDHVELNVDTFVCSCTFGQNPTVRPCSDMGLDGIRWGGIGTNTCGDVPSQTMTVVCQ